MELMSTLEPFWPFCIYIYTSLSHHCKPSKQMNQTFFPPGILGLLCVRIGFHLLVVIRYLFPPEIFSKLIGQKVNPINHSWSNHFHFGHFKRDLKVLTASINFWRPVKKFYLFLIFNFPNVFVKIEAELWFAINNQPGHLETCRTSFPLTVEPVLFLS